MKRKIKLRGSRMWAKCFCDQSDGEFLKFIADRLENVYGEHPLFGYMQRLRELAHNLTPK